MHIILLFFFSLLTFANSADADSHGQSLCLCPECITGNYEVFRASSSHMSPTVQPHSCIVIEALESHDTLPPRGTIITYRHPITGEINFSRLIGLPGDRVQMKAGTLHLNGKAIPKIPQEHFKQKIEINASGAPSVLCPPSSSITQDGFCATDQYLEYLPNGVSYSVLDLGDRSLDDTKLFNVPEDYIFVLGDNRDNSSDSRIPVHSAGLGFIHKSKLRGKWHSYAKSIEFSGDIPRQKLFRDIFSGMDAEEFRGNSNWVDCTEDGQVAFCAPHQSFLDAKGILIVYFTQGLSNRVIFLSEDISFFENAKTLFTSRKYTPCLLAKSDETLDLVNLRAKSDGASYVAKVTEFENEALSSGTISITYSETNFQNVPHYESCQIHSYSLEPGQRVITLSMHSGLPGTMTNMAFDLNARDQLEFANSVSRKLDEDF